MPIALPSLLFVTMAAELLGAPPLTVEPEPVSTAPMPEEVTTAPVPEGVDFLPGARQHRSDKPPRRDAHELRDPTGWSAEPPPPEGPVDAARFDAAVVALCAEVVPDASPERRAEMTPQLEAVARVVREVAAETHADPFLLAALAYRQSHCHPALVSSRTGGVGLLQIEPEMFAAGATLPFPREDLAEERLLDPAHNLRVGAALLAMWEERHAEIDRWSGSTPHRTAVAHLVWGDRVWGSTTEDRTLTARRRLLATYAPAPPEAEEVAEALDLVSPLEGGPRLGISGPGEDREAGRRSHRGIDVDAGFGEPVRAVADGVVQFAGVDLRGHAPARGLLPRQLKRWRHRSLGPGGFFVRIMHADGVRTGYFHLHDFSVVEGQVVKTGEVIGRVGLTGVKASEPHLHFEVHEDGELGDPVRFLAAFVLPPADTVNHDHAMAEQRNRLARVRRARRHARAHRVG